MEIAPTDLRVKGRASSLENKMLERWKGLG